MDYNAEEQVTEMRTIGADGKLQQKVEYEYRPGFYGAQRTDTTYWPSGTTRQVAHNSYDENTNFTGEFVQIYDQAGRQVGGHKLSHDPWSGVFRCSEWNVAAHDYRSVECPAGEESGGGAEEVKKFTYNEVKQHLDAARKRAQGQQKIQHMQPAAMIQPPVTTASREVGVVLPTRIHAGERVSGTVVEDPTLYEGMADFKVTRVAVPFESAGEASQLWGWLVEVPGEKARRADGPISFVVPPQGTTLEITFRQAGNPEHTVSRSLALSLQPATKQGRPKSFHAAALCLKNGLCAATGPFSGDSNKTFAAFEDRPAAIVAETSEAAWIEIPEMTEPGPRPLFLAERSKLVALPVTVGAVVLNNSQVELKAGQKLILSVILDGASEIPESEWRPGNFPAGNLTQARHLIPGFQVAEKHEAESNRRREPIAERRSKEDREEGEGGGEVLLVVKNFAPESSSLHASKDQMLVFRLSHESFSRGPFKYDYVVESTQTGRLNLRSYAIPFLAPIVGQQFEVKPPAR